MGSGASVSFKGHVGQLMTTYQVRPTDDYSESLHLFSSDLTKLHDSIHPPRPPTTRKKDIPDINKIGKIDRKIAKVSQNVIYLKLPNFLFDLLGPLWDDVFKVRALYCWVATFPIDTLKNQGKDPDKSTPEYYLWRIKKKTGNHAQLFNILCRVANIPCMIIHGYRKDRNFEIGEQINDKQHYAEWNAVYVAGDWRLLDAQWGSGIAGSNVISGQALDQEQTDDEEEEQGDMTTIAMDENYFLTDPSQFLNSHFPVDFKWQLMDQPISKATFEKQALYQECYFQTGIKAISHKYCLIECSGSEVEVKFQLTDEKSKRTTFHVLFVNWTDAKSSKFVENNSAFCVLQKTEKDILIIRLRAPKIGSYKVELLVEDGDTGDHVLQSVVIYKVVFKKSNDTPLPSLVQLDDPKDLLSGVGLSQLNHMSGEVFSIDGTVEIKYNITDNELFRNTMFVTKIYSNEYNDSFTDRIVFRNENGKYIFNLKLPRTGEYGFQLKARPLDSSSSYPVSCLLITTDKNAKRQLCYPPGFENELGPKIGLGMLGLIPVSHRSGIIYCDTIELIVIFRKTKDVELSGSLTGSDTRSSGYKMLVSQELVEDLINFKLTLPSQGTYGFKIIGSLSQSVNTEPFKPIYDYIIEYAYKLPRQNTDSWIQRSDSAGSKRTVETVLSGVQNSIMDSTMSATENLEKESKMRLNTAIQTENKDELEAVLEVMCSLDQSITDVASEITRGEKELDYLYLKHELESALAEKNITTMREAVEKANRKQCTRRFEDQLKTANKLIERLQKIQMGLHDIKSLGSHTILEIRKYSKPPQTMVRVMVATLMILGHTEEEVEEWSKIQAIVGKTGQESIKNRIKAFDINVLPIDVALAAKDYTRGLTLDQIRIVSAGAAAFFVWTKGIISEVESRYGDNLSQIHPRTSKKPHLK